MAIRDKLKFFFTFDLLEFSLTLLKIINLHPFERKLNVYTINKFLLIFSASVLLLLTALNFLVQHIDVLDFIRKVESICTLLQVFPKLYTMIFYKKHIQSLFRQLKYFWPNADSFYTNIGIRCSRFFIFWLSLMDIILLLRIFFLNEFNVYCYIPERYFINFATVKAFQMLYMFYIYFIVLGFDILLITMCIKLYHQFQLLETRLQLIINSETAQKDRDFAICVEHHVVILNFANNMRELYSTYFAWNYMNCLITICVELYLISLGVLDASAVTKCVFYIVGIIFQLGIYCFPLSALTEEIENVGESLYSSEWYNQELYFQKNVLIVLNRTQMPLNFTAAGLLNINRETFVEIFKASMSVLTLIRAIEDK